MILGPSPGLAAALVLGSYLLGAVPFSYLIVRSLSGRDVRSLGSGNAGATNVLRAQGWGAAVATLLLDAGKGAGAVLGAQAAGVPVPVVGACAAAAVAGHVFPVFLGFRGGKGVATAAGALLVLAPWVWLAALGIFGLLVAARGYVSLASMVTVALAPWLVLMRGSLGWGRFGDAWIAIALTVIAVLVIARHGANIRRLRAGTEPTLGRSGEAG